MVRQANGWKVEEVDVLSERLAGARPNHGVAPMAAGVIERPGERRTSPRIQGAEQLWAPSNVIFGRPGVLTARALRGQDAPCVLSIVTVWARPDAYRRRDGQGDAADPTQASAAANGAASSIKRSIALSPLDEFFPVCRPGDPPCQDRERRSCR